MHEEKNASLQRIFARMFSIRKPCRLVSLVTYRHFSQTIEQPWNFDTGSRLNYIPVIF